MTIRYWQPTRSALGMLADVRIPSALHFRMLITHLLIPLMSALLSLLLALVGVINGALRLYILDVLPCIIVCHTAIPSLSNQRHARLR